ncbi:type I-F CRISPR-associated protein Csy1 [Acetobacteraceae bacterium]|nr:type I-F CRISPR-associated protein Csy1 [Acetobacteraceae bacterium]
MTNLSRQKIFETAIASFLNEKRIEEERKKQGSKPEKYNKPEWLEKTATILRKTSVQIGTHLPKATHSDVKGGTIYAKNLPQRKEIGSHLLSEDQILPDAAGNGAENAVVLEGWQFLHLPISLDGKTLPLKAWLKAEDADAFAALSEVTGKGKQIASRFLAFVEREAARENEGVSDGNSKQLYWLNQGGNVLENQDFILLQPLYPSSLAQLIYKDFLSASRFGDQAKEGRKARKEKRFWEGTLQEFPRMAVRHLGGTKPQNVSQLNSLRRGAMEFFSSAPPVWQVKTQRRPPLKTEKPIMGWILSHGAARKALEALVSFLKKNPRAVMATRNYRDYLQDCLSGEILSQAETLRQILPVGWSAEKAHQKLPLCERLWLDTGRIEATQNFQTEEDEIFRQKYHEGRWADEIADEVAHCINDALRKAGLAVGDVEHDYWARNQALMLEVAWPTPMHRKSTFQRRADGQKIEAKR